MGGCRGLLNLREHLTMAPNPTREVREGLTTEEIVKAAQAIAYRVDSLRKERGAGNRPYFSSIANFIATAFKSAHWCLLVTYTSFPPSCHTGVCLSSFIE